MAEMWLYNGVKLPALPEHDPELYEAAIFNAVSFYYLVLQESGYGFYGVHDFDNWYVWDLCLDSEDAPIQVYACDSNNPNFTFWMPIATGEITEASLIPVWTNTEDYGHDRGFHDADTDELILESSEPVPVTSPEEPEQPEEPEETDPISYIEYMANPKYRKYPFRGFFGWLWAKKHIGGGSDVAKSALVSSDGYTLQDVNGLNLIPKEGN